MFGSLYRSNCKQIKSIVADAIDTYEKDLMSEGSFKISCKSDVLEKVDEYLQYFKVPLSKYTYSHSELEETAMCYLSNGSFELFEGHKYRVFGQIDWTGPASNARYVHKRTIQWCVEHSFITQDDADEDALALKDVIRMKL